MTESNYLVNIAGRVKSVEQVPGEDLIIFDPDTRDSWIQSLNACNLGEWR